MRLPPLSNQQEISPIVRATSGLIGILGFAAVAFNASQDGDLQLSAMLVASFFAGFIFLYVSFFGKYPWNKRVADNAARSDGSRPKTGLRSANPEAYFIDADLAVLDLEVHGRALILAWRHKRSFYQVLPFGLADTNKIVCAPIAVQTSS